jgi:hypothetical protein
MKHGGKMLVCLAGSLVLCTTATARVAAAAGNPYQGIVERNVFGLKAPPPPPDPEANKAPLPKITLTGIVTLGGAKRALLKVPPGPPKPGEPAKTEQGFILSVGERQGEIEVLEIDEKAGSVKVNYAGTVTNLTFDKDGVKTASAPGAVPPPGMPPPMKAVMAVPGPMGGAGMAPTPFPMRSVRTPGMGGSVSPQAAGGAGLPGVNVGGTSLNLGGNSLALGSGASVNPSVTPQPTGPQLSPEERVLLYEANRLKTEQAIQAGERRVAMPRHPWAAGLDQGTGAAPAPAPAPMLPLPPGGPQQYPPPAAQ